MLFNVEKHNKFFFTKLPLLEMKVNIMSTNKARSTLIVT